MESRGRDARWIFVKAAVVGHIIEQESEMLSEAVNSVAEFRSLSQWITVFLPSQLGNRFYIELVFP